MKIIKLVTAYFVLFSLSVFNANAQQLLTIEDAVKIALENNYDIKIAKNDLKIDEMYHRKCRNATSSHRYSY
jgi:hypothetical protein